MPLLSENSNDRVMLFMDLQNILRSVEAIGTLKLDLDFYTMAVQLAGTRHLVGMYAFDTRKPWGMEDRFKRLHGQAPLHGLPDRGT
ncbi:MAG TPA: hypothetical protein PKX52_03095 [Methanomassiliicoccaceae archaeon]|nr:hypothetical protein [Methanomassiliicoccaceae archaeon]HQD88529.1 hypothetical protein [Methanomassiliicoccaceae archaeon]